MHIKMFIQYFVIFGIPLDFSYSYFCLCFMNTLLYKCYFIVLLFCSGKYRKYELYELYILISYFLRFEFEQILQNTINKYFKLSEYFHSRAGVL
jgi:hypothetical protein